MKRLLYIVTIFLAAAACTREPLIDDESVVDKNGLVRVSLVTGETGTRTEVREVTVDGKTVLRPFWSEEDAVRLVPNPLTTSSLSWESAYVFNCEWAEGDDGSVAHFCGDASFGEYYAFYAPGWWNSEWHEWVNPNIYKSGDKGVFEFNIPYVQYPSPTSFDPSADLLVSNLFAITEDTEYDVEKHEFIVDGICFTRMNAIVKLVFQDLDGRFEGQTVRRVTFSLSDPNQSGGGGEIMNAPAQTRAYLTDNDDDLNGLAGWVDYKFPETEGQNGYNVSYASQRSVTAVYGDETYTIGEEGAATYLITVPCILKNSESESWDYEAQQYVSYTEGLYIQVETDNFVITRNVILPAGGLALQPSRVTSLNINLYGDGIEGTTIQTIGMSIEPEVTLKTGKSTQLEAMFVGITPYSDDLEELVWTSSDNSVVTVEPVRYSYGGDVEYSPYATITAKAEGTATITATYRGMYVATCEVTVVVIPEQPSRMIDLGLTSGTKWAEWDMGAQSWEQEGDRYAWGETQYRDIFSWDTYRWAAGKNILTKYTSAAVYTPDHQIDNKFLLDLSDDAAYVNWGEDWYTPTREQWKELFSECSWDFVYDDEGNVIACAAIGPNENRIYFPSTIRTYYYRSFYYMSSTLPLPDRGSDHTALDFYPIGFEGWNGSSGVSVSSYSGSSPRGEDSAYIRPVSGGLSLRKEPDLGVVTLEPEGNTISAQFPVYESEREQEYKNNPDYPVYDAYAVIIYSTDSSVEPGNYKQGRFYDWSGESSSSGHVYKYKRFTLEEYENKQVCSLVPEGMTGTIFYRAYYYSCVKESTNASNALIVNEKWGVTRCITIP